MLPRERLHRFATVEGAVVPDPDATAPGGLGRPRVRAGLASAPVSRSTSATGKSTSFMRLNVASSSEWLTRFWSMSFMPD